MKKLVSLGIVTLATLSLAACGNNNSTNKDSYSSKARSESVAKAKWESKAKKASLAKAKSESKAKAASESQAKAASESKAKADSESAAAASSSSAAAASSAAVASSQATQQSAAASSSAVAASATVASSQAAAASQVQQQTTQTQGEINRERGYDPNGNPVMPGQDHAAGTNPDGTTDSWVSGQEQWAKQNGYANQDGTPTAKGQAAIDETMQNAY
ncbi:hypothetical protein [Furfurilactobacillus curtus]|uniref:Lipoprotein n=1 Tax=Furfurilactobacillus curtus TaxID=1746200 RepID=A0ABQ5JK55_9LACO